MELAVSACRSLCDWARTPAATADGRRLFACRGCGSQWVRGAGWTPAQADGTVPAAVRAELSAGAAGSAGS